MIATEEARVRRQLAEGAAPDRVRAAWDLALRLGGEAIGPLRDQLGREPSPGARRHVVVVLAGLGEREAVRVIAEHDADALVRATASRYVVLTSDDDETRWLAGRIATDPTAELAQVALELVGDAPPPHLAHALDGLLTHPSYDVRLALVERYERSGAPASVVDRVAEERDPDVRARLAFIALGHDANVLARVDHGALVTVLQRVLADGVVVPWRSLSSFATSPSLVCSDAALALHVLERDPDAPVDLLLALAEASWAEPDQMALLIERAERSAFTAETRRRLETWLERTSPMLQPAEDDSYPPREEELAFIRALVERVETLLARRLAG